MTVFNNARNPFIIAHTNAMLQLYLIRGGGFCPTCVLYKWGFCVLSGGILSVTQ